jgi:LuxR family transcriptional regulator, quorum-sensing system regulator BjaR1
MAENHIESRVLDYIDRVNDCRSRSEILTEFFAAVATFGVTSVLITELPPPGSRLEQFTLLNGWPQAWFDRYTEKRYFDIDQVALSARSAIEPYRWSEIAEKTPADSCTRRIMAEAKEAQLDDGLVVPIFGTHGTQFAATMGGRAIDFRDRARHALQLMAVYCHHRAQILAPRWSISEDMPAKRLSTREKDCLRWIARGKSNWEVGQIIGISAHTVDAHMRTCMAKLVAVNRTQAVAKALSARLISL